MGEKDENSKIGIMIDGEFKEIKPISDMDLDTELENCETPPNSRLLGFEHYEGDLVQFETNFTASNEALRQLGVFIDLKHLREYTNNWRKLHGLPMRRKKVR